jgi:DNA polymerase-1
MARSTKRQVTLLIDADVLAYQAANGEQRVTDWGDGVTSVVMGTLEEGIALVLTEADRLKKKLKATKYVLCLTHPVQFRKRILPTYKLNRSALTKPLLVDPIRDALVRDHGAVRRPQLEGDDIMGIYATHPTLIPGAKIIVSIDKDMRQIPGMLYNPGTNDLGKVSVEEADYFHYLQIITGDPTDNYKGIPGVGPVGARAILEGPPEKWWDRIVYTYKAKGLTEADALIQAQVARICRASDYNFKTKEPILWTPSSS